MGEIQESGTFTITLAEAIDNPLLFFNESILHRIKQAGGPVEGNIFPKIIKGYEFTTDSHFESGDKIVRWRKI